MPFSFLEILVIVIIGILVIGPKNLPGTIKKIMLWYRHIKGSMTNIQQKIDQTLDNELNDIQNIKQEPEAEIETKITKKAKCAKPKPVCR